MDRNQCEILQSSESGRKGLRRKVLPKSGRQRPKKEPTVKVQRIRLGWGWLIFDNGDIIDDLGKGSLISEVKRKPGNYGLLIQWRQGRE